MSSTEQNWQDRVDKKLDMLTEVIEKLARIDERMLSTFTRMDRYDDEQREIEKQLANNEKRIAEIEAKSTGQVVKLDWIERVFWIVIVAIVTFFLNNGLGV